MSLPFRKGPKPYSRAIAWAPTDGRTTRAFDRSSPYELFVSQSALRDVRSHLVSAQNPEPYGFLLGHVVYCPWTNAPYVVIDAARRGTHDVPHGGDHDAFRQAWAATSRDARRRRGQIIGWYHQHGVLGLHLSQWDLKLQEEFFPEAWHCALLIVPGARGPIGGFIQRSSRARLYRRGISGFYELVDLDAKSVNGMKASVVDWTNHRPAEQVEVQHVEWPVSRRRWPPDPGKRESRGESAGQTDVTPLHAEAPALEPEETAPGEASSLESSDWRPTGGAGLERKRAWKTRKARKPHIDPSATREEPDEPDLAKGFAEAVGTTSAEDAEASPPEPTETAEANGAAPSPMNQDEGEVSHFMEAVWGPAPYEAEAGEGPLEHFPDFKGLPPWEGPERLTAADVASAMAIPPARETRTPPREPPEIESPERSLDWLLDLVEQTLGETLTPTGPEVDELAPPVHEEAVEGDEPEPDETRGDACDARGPDGAAPLRPGDQAEDPEGPRGSGSTPVPTDPPPTAGDLAAHVPRAALVGAAADPEADPEVAIPFVMPTEEGAGAVAALRRGRWPVLIVLIAIVLALAVWFVVDRGQPPQSEFRTPVAPAGPTARPGELQRLERQFTASVAAYRERSADFGLGRIDCAGLRIGIEAALASFGELSEYAAGVPDEATEYWRHEREMREATQHFGASGCERPEIETQGSAP